MIIICHNVIGALFLSFTRQTWLEQLVELGVLALTDQLQDGKLQLGLRAAALAL